MKQIRQAIIIMIVAILTSSSVSAVSSMNNLAKIVSNQFYQGSHGDNLCIYEDLMDKAELATKLVSLSKDFVSSSDANVKAIQDTVNQMKKETSVSKLYKQMVTLDTNFDALVAKLNGANLNETQAKYLKGYVSSYKSEGTTIGSDPYNSMVKAYFDETSGLLGAFYRMFATKVEYFK
ncbi:MAG: hypothetical protein IJI05_05990 [Erysipelotrichaceae bacterium]|nr:hypothetical protein [Erysipelotrichaceae bacterium]